VTATPPRGGRRLVALDGLARVIAFLGAGLVLLAAGTRYARLVAEAEQPPPG